MFNVLGKALPWPMNLLARSACQFVSIASGWELNALQAWKVSPTCVHLSFCGVRFRFLSLCPTLELTMSEHVRLCAAKRGVQMDGVVHSRRGYSVGVVATPRSCQRAQ